MAEEKKEQYCRVCGSGKGHAFPHCKNIIDMKKIIALQDDETQGHLAELKRNREQLGKMASIEANNSLLSRLVYSLLDLAEAHRIHKRD